VIMTKITPQGLELLKKMDAPMRDLPRELFGDIGRQKLQSLLQLLTVIRQKAA
jgi:hypothetical protein